MLKEFHDRPTCCSALLSPVVVNSGCVVQVCGRRGEKPAGVGARVKVVSGTDGDGHGQAGCVTGLLGGDALLLLSIRSVHIIRHCEGVHASSI